MSLIRWSAATTRTTVPAPRRSARQAATATAAAESRRIGSSAISASTPTAWSCSATMKRTSFEAKMSGFEKAGWLNRLAVTWKFERSSSRGMNCFGMLSRDAGHSRVPEPPHMMTGRIFGEETATDGDGSAADRSVISGVSAAAGKEVRVAMADNVKQENVFVSGSTYIGDAGQRVAKRELDCDVLAVVGEVATRAVRSEARCGIRNWLRLVDTPGAAQNVPTIPLCQGSCRTPRNPRAIGQAVGSCPSRRPAGAYSRVARPAAMKAEPWTCHSGRALRCIRS